MNGYLSIPHHLVATYPPRLRQLLGFELYRGIMGHVDGQSPSAAIGVPSRRHNAYGGSGHDNPFGVTDPGP